MWRTDDSLRPFTGSLELFTSFDEKEGWKRDGAKEANGTL